jgi:hypothetical protein
MKGVADADVPQLISIRSKDFIGVTLFGDVRTTALRAVADFSFGVLFVRNVLIYTTSHTMINRFLVVCPELVIIFRTFDNVSDSFQLLLLLVALALF